MSIVLSHRMYVRIFLTLWLLASLQCDPRKGNSDSGGRTQSAEKEVPILCYHNIKSNLDHHSAALTITEKDFDDQIKMLSDSGYHTILPDQLYNYLTKDVALPPKPIMITFDDSHEEHFSIASKELEKYGFRGVFFVMTIVIDKHNYLTHDEISALAKNGHVVACHTYEHPLMTRLNDSEWTKEIDEPRELLEKITGKPVDFFAYPYGAWNERVIDQLKKRGIKAAFQLSEAQSPEEPLYTIRRIMVSDSWSTTRLNAEIHTAFNQSGLAFEGENK